MSALPRTSPEAPAIAGASFGRSGDGLLVALVGETAYAMAPAGEGKHHLASGWRIARPLAQWTRADFYGHGGEIDDEAAFRTKVLEQAQHQEERRQLARREIPGGALTPWGSSQGGTVYAEGVTAYATAGHGGFQLSAERRRAERTIKDSWPDAWEAIFGTILGPGKSRTKDQRAFESEHVTDWIVVSAIRSDQQKGFVECIATPGGKRGVGIEERRFLVPTDEYHIGRFGFVIDPDRHSTYAGGSSFVAWQSRGSP